VHSTRVTVPIEIKPGSTPSPINLKSNGKIPVAIISTPTFNALSTITSTITFGHSGYESSLLFCNQNGEDVNGDGLLDLVCHFSVAKTGFQIGDTEGIVKGIASGRVLFQGSGAVAIVGH
jgi:hypothetical protein